MSSDTNLSSKIKNFIIKDCEARDYEEACGLIFKTSENTVKVVSCQNDSITPKKAFVINENTVDRISKKYKIIGYYHSHICENDEGFSWIDKAMSEYTNFISILYNIKNKNLLIYKPHGWVAPLIGRDYFTGFFDSFSLIKDYYQDLIKINNNFSYHRYIRPIHEISVYHKEILYKIIKKYDFFELNDKKNKCLCLLIKDDIPYAFAIYENGEFLTQLFGEKSKKYSKKELTKKQYKIKYYWNGKIS